MVYSSGTVFWSRPGTFKMKCAAAGVRGERPEDPTLRDDIGGNWPSPVDLRLFPYDTQRCEVLVGSWSFSSKEVNLTLMGPGNPWSTSTSVDPRGLSTGLSSESTEFFIHQVVSERIEKLFSCCPDEPYPLMYFYITMERFNVDHTITIILPIFVSVLCGFFAFLIPPELGERIGLGITCVLTVMAVMFIISENLPATMHVTLLSVGRCKLDPDLKAPGFKA